jgi:octaprenyl-diphosphate synthase
LNCLDCQRAKHYTQKRFYSQRLSCYSRWLAKGCIRGHSAADFDPGLSRFAPLICEFRRPVPALTETPLSLDPVRELLADDMDAVDAVIRSRLDSDVLMVRTIAEYIIGGGGKRLRPLLLLLASRALDYRGRHHHELAAVVEFIHTATLLHDDVVDESALRRGRQTANAMFGNAASVLVGDFLYSRSFQMMVGIGDMRVMQVLADATNVIAEGEVLQLMNCRDANVDEAAYLRVIRYKTAKLFEAAMRLGAMLAKAPPAVEVACAEYGARLGTAFQLIDDVLDYSGDLSETGKNLGDDLAEGKPTLQLIYVMAHGSAAQAGLVRSAIESGGIEKFDAIVEAVLDTGALDYVRRAARAEADAADAAISSVPDSKYRECLLQLSRFAVERTF